MDAAGDGELVHSLVSIGKQTALHTVNVRITVIIIKSQQSCLMGELYQLETSSPKASRACQCEHVHAQLCNRCYQLEPRLIDRPAGVVGLG